jgi:hypothetical protein
VTEPTCSFALSSKLAILSILTIMNPDIQSNVEFKDTSGQSRNLSRAVHLISALATADKSRYVFFSVWCLRKHSTAPDHFTSHSRLHGKVLHPSFYFFHRRSLPLYQSLRPLSSATLPSHEILCFSFWTSINNRLLNTRSFRRSFCLLWCSYPHTNFKNRFNSRRGFERG